MVTNQAWGASWDGLETEIKDEISRLMNSGLRLSSPGSWTCGDGYRWAVRVDGTYEEFLNERRPVLGEFTPAQYTTVYGVELQGTAPAGCVNIDHHCYENDDRSNEKSSLEQVAEILGHKLSVREQFIAANDKGYIPAMKALAETFSLSEEGAEEIISEVRLADRNAQGITPEQEVLAEEAIASKEVDGDLTVVTLAHSKCATVTDRLFGQHTELLIVCGDGEVDYYGPHTKVTALQEQFGGWSGKGFWGSCEANPEEVRKAL